MITNRDLAVIPMEAARAAVEPDAWEADARERLAEELTDRSLERVHRVVLRLLHRASVADPAARRAMLREADELDAAVRAARDVILPPVGSHDHAGHARLPVAGSPELDGRRPGPPTAGGAAWGRGDTLARRIAGAAADLAATENRIAEVYERLADARPDAAGRLRATAELARQVARRERAEQYRHEATAAPGTVPERCDG